MSDRLDLGGRLINRNDTIKFKFNGESLQGFQGDTLASALLANDKMLVGRSFKYHRPRGVVASGLEEPNALVGLGEGPLFEPNQRATTTELFDGLTAKSQNHWPSLQYDLGAINSFLWRFFPAGFYYKMFIHPRAFWKYIYEPIIRKSAGLGVPPKQQDTSKYEHLYAFYDVVVVGGGIAGLIATKAAAASGQKVLLVEQTATWGGRTQVDHERVDGEPIDKFINDLLAELVLKNNVTMRARMMGAGVYDHGYLLCYERVSDHRPSSKELRHRLWRIRAAQIITATGALEKPLTFAGNDIPGVVLASALRDYVINFGVYVGQRTVIVTNNDDAYLTAKILKRAGLDVPLIIDTRSGGAGIVADEVRKLGVRVETGAAIAKVEGSTRVKRVYICPFLDDGRNYKIIDCDCVAMSGGWSPVVNLWSHCGGKLIWDQNQLLFRPDKEHAPKNHNGSPFVSVVGAANGYLRFSEIKKDAAMQGALSSGQKEKGFTPINEDSSTKPPEEVLVMPHRAGSKLKAKAWLDFQNDVKVSDIELAAQEGFESVEHAKRYTTLGMATDQGKLSNVNGLAILASSIKRPISEVGTTTFRPPYAPISMGSIAGLARGDVFQPVRKSPIHGWHENNRAFMEPVGQWRRPFCFPRAGETHRQAVEREVVSARSSVGLLDASTLGKILLKGSDAGKLVDMLYTGLMSNLGIGRCRYGLMCNENGFLIDDGVVARLADDEFLCHTTTGGADFIHSHIEEWLQTEWWDWQVYTINLTEQFAQFSIVGPNSRRLLEKLGGIDVSKENFPFMAWLDAKIAGFDVRVYRISFSGELSYEVSISSDKASLFWDAILEAGKEFGITPYGTEALHVMRAEKGFIMIGDETDGTVTPQDLGLDWAISKKKPDYIGKRAQERPNMLDPDRWKLVGLQSLDGSVLPEGAYAIGSGKNANGQEKTIGRVTSTYFSPTLKKGIAMGLVKHGPQRKGEIISFARVNGTPTEAKIVDQVFFDKNGDRQNV